MKGIGYPHHWDTSGTVGDSSRSNPVCVYATITGPTNPALGAEWMPPCRPLLPTEAITPIIMFAGQYDIANSALPGGTPTGGGDTPLAIDTNNRIRAMQAALARAGIS